MAKCDPVVSPGIKKQNPERSLFSEQTSRWIPSEHDGSILLRLKRESRLLFVTNSCADIHSKLLICIKHFTWRGWSSPLTGVLHRHIHSFSISHFSKNCFQGQFSTCLRTGASKSTETYQPRRTCCYTTSI